VNYLAVLLAAASSFVLGGLWYSPRLVGRVWNRENGGQPPAGHPAKAFGLSFAFSRGPDPAVQVAIQKGVLVGLA